MRPAFLGGAADQRRVDVDAHALQPLDTTSGGVR